jgi:hypothetical protein
MINRSLIPQHTFNLCNYSDAVGIAHDMKKLQIKKYVYMFSTALMTLKYGSSKDNEWKRKGIYGERIYRQAHHIPGWLNGCAGPLTSGYDFREILTHCPTLTKNDIIITVWDMSNYPFLAANKPKEVEEFENELIHNFKNLHGRRPIGNPKDMSYASNVTVVSDSIFNHIFS